jgi:integrase
LEEKVAYAEKRGNLWRARWRAPDGTLESRPGFTSRKDAENYGRDQEASIRAGTYVGPRAGQITLTEWVNRWFPALDLELTTLRNYRYLIEVLILPAFGDRPLASLRPEEVSAWELRLVERGYSRRTARDARSTLTTVLGDAIPQHLQVNPAQRRRGKGRKGQSRIERHEQAEKTWATPLQALLVAERCAALSGCDTDFVMIVTIAWTGMRWGEAVGLAPECVGDETIGIEWKLYELGGRLYRGRPKDGSIRPADLPPFLADLLAAHLAASVRMCTCRGAGPPWCPGSRYVFLGPAGGHYRRSAYGARFFRPAADGWYPARGQREAAPVLADAAFAFPGRPVPPWPAAVAGEPFEPPAGRGITRLTSDARAGRCPGCGRAQKRRRDGHLITHNAPDGGRCGGSGQMPAEDTALASWLPVLPALTPHGLRHGHQTWLEEAGISDLLRSERMGHEVPGMRGVYGHVSPAMRADLKAVLQERWQDAMRERKRVSPRSVVPVLDALLTAELAGPAKIGSRLAPRIGHEPGNSGRRRPTAGR